MKATSSPPRVSRLPWLKVSKALRYVAFTHAFARSTLALRRSARRYTVESVASTSSRRAGASPLLARSSSPSTEDGGRGVPGGFSSSMLEPS